MHEDTPMRDRLLPRLKRLYGDRAEECLDAILASVDDLENVSLH